MQHTYIYLLASPNTGLIWWCSNAYPLVSFSCCHPCLQWLLWHRWDGCLGRAPGRLGLPLWMHQPQPSQSRTCGQEGVPRYSLGRWMTQTLLQTDAWDLNVPVSPAVPGSLRESCRREEPHNTVQGATCNVYIVLKKWAWLIIFLSNLLLCRGAQATFHNSFWASRRSAKVWWAKLSGLW